MGNTNWTIENSCPRCKANKPIYVKIKNRHFIKCAECSYTFELVGTDTFSTNETLED